MRWLEQIASAPRRHAELIAVVALLGLAAAERLGLALRGWPYINSDEATIGLMADDILWHGARPAVMYGQHYLGAFQAYLAALAFAVFGATDATLHLVTTLETLAALVVLYGFARVVFSRGVALVTLALLALGPDQAIFYEIRAGAHAQDVLLFGSLILLLTALRLRRRWGWRAVLLSLSLGLAVGVGLWGSFLLLPYAGVSLLALLCEALLRRHRPHAWRRAAAEGAAWLGGALVGLAPLLAVTIASRGIVVREVLSAAALGATARSAPGGLAGALSVWGDHLGGTFLVALPDVLGRGITCAGCSDWPAAYSGHPAVDAVVLAALRALPLTLAALALWGAAMAGLLAPVARWRAAGAGAPRLGTNGRARWWGRAMLVVGSGVTVLAFVASSASFVAPNTAARYLVGIYLCAPLAAAPLWPPTRSLLAALARAGTGGRMWRVWRVPRRVVPTRAGGLALAASAALLALLALSAAGAASDWAQAANPRVYGVPAGSRDLALLRFLRAHDATRFLTTYWVCNRLMFDAREAVTCGVVQSRDPLRPGLNREPAMLAAALAAAHPAYVFDLRTTPLPAPAHALLNTDVRPVHGDAAGYRRAMVDGYLVLYYAR